MSRPNLKVKVTVELEDVLWECENCGNLYDPQVPECPNRLLDLWLIGKRR